MDADREARRAVVGEHALPGSLLGQVGNLRGRLEGKRQLPLRSLCADARRARSEAEPPEQLPARPAERVAGTRRDESLERRAVERRPLCELHDAAEAVGALTLLDERLRGPLAQPLDVAEADADGVALDAAAVGAHIEVGWEHLDAAPLSVANEARR